MRYAIIQDSQVINIVASDRSYDQSWIEVDDTVQIGYTWDGEAFTAPTVTPSIPSSVTPLQAKAALLAVGKLSIVQTLMNDPNTDPLIVLAWNNAMEFRRDSPMLLGLAEVFGWSSEDLDNLFISASEISV